MPRAIFLLTGYLAGIPIIVPLKKILLSLINNLPEIFMEKIEKKSLQKPNSLLQPAEVETPPGFEVQRFRRFRCVRSRVAQEGWTSTRPASGRGRKSHHSYRVPFLKARRLLTYMQCLIFMVIM